MQEECQHRPLSLRMSFCVTFLAFFFIYYYLLFYRLWVQGGGRDVVGSSVLAAGQFVVPPRTTHALTPSLAAWRDMTQDTSLLGRGRAPTSSTRLPCSCSGASSRNATWAHRLGVPSPRTHPGQRLVWLAPWLAHNSLGVACRVWPRTTGEKTTLTMPVGLIEGTETIIFYSLFIGESSPSPHSTWGHSRLTPTQSTIIQQHPTTSVATAPDGVVRVVRVAGGRHHPPTPRLGLPPPRQLNRLVGQVTSWHPQQPQQSTTHRRRRRKGEAHVMKGSLHIYCRGLFTCPVT